MKGKVKSISVKEVTEGVQLLDHINQIGIITKNGLLRYCDGSEAYHSVSKLKTLVVEYDSSYYGGIAPKWIPLKYSQWQSAIDNGEVDSDNVVEFEIPNRGMGKCLQCGAQQLLSYVVCNYNGICTGRVVGLPQYAKIIPQKKKMYSEEDVHKSNDASVD